MRTRRSLASGAFRFALLLALVFAIGSGALLVVVERAIQSYTADTINDNVASESAILVGEERDGGRSAIIRAIGRHQQAVRERDFRYLLTAPGGVRLAGDLPIAAARLGRFRLGLREWGKRRHRWRVKPLVLLGVDLRDGARLVVAADTTDMEKLRRRLLWFTGGFGAAIALLVMVGGLFVGSLFLRRLDRINAAIERINGGAMSVRLPPIGMGPEFDQLTDNLNGMLERIERLIEGLRQVSVGIAHDLRTPLTRLRHRLEDGAEGRALDVDGAIAQVDAILAIFAALLRIGTLESGAARIHFVTVPLSPFVTSVVDAYAPAAEDAGRPIAASIAPDIVVQGDRELLGQALTNLIENALLHATSATRIAVSLHRDDAGIALIVEDNGVGVPLDERSKIARRFYRLDRSRSSPGSGLGLSLVVAIADLHGGGVEFDDARPGLGVTITLPHEGAAR